MKGVDGTMSTELDILRVAILNEQEGYQFYKAAADRAVNEDAKNAFLQFAQEEKAHEDMLRKMYAQLKTASKGSVYDPDGGSISHPQLFKRTDSILNDEYELAAYRIAILLEEAAIRFYTEGAGRTTSADVKKLFLDLAVWETSHRDTFTAVYDRLSQAWGEKESL